MEAWFYVDLFLCHSDSPSSVWYGQRSTGLWFGGFAHISNEWQYWLIVWGVEMDTKTKVDRRREQIQWVKENILTDQSHARTSWELMIIYFSSVLCPLPCSSHQSNSERFIQTLQSSIKLLAFNFYFAPPHCTLYNISPLHSSSLPSNAIHFISI